MTDEALDYAVRRTADYVEGAAEGTRFRGDHLNALCRVARPHAPARERERPSRRPPTSSAR